jgi:hypothetical protein
MKRALPLASAPKGRGTKILAFAEVKGSKFRYAAALRFAVRTVVTANEMNADNWRLGPYRWLLFEHQRRPADSLPLEVDSHLDAVGDPDEGNAAVHAVVLTVESHCPFDFS